LVLVLVMAEIIPLRGHFENAQAFLHWITQDASDIKEFVIYAIEKDGTPKFAHFEMTRATMAFVAATLLEHCRSDDY
jgi:hypothetical protein